MKDTDHTDQEGLDELLRMDLTGTGITRRNPERVDRLIEKADELEEILEDSGIAVDLILHSGFNSLAFIALSGDRIDIYDRRALDLIKNLYGICVSGGIASTGLIDNIQKPAIFDTLCYTDPKHRAEFLRIVREAAEVFDEIILDDYYFTSCRCELCISEKGNRSWKDFRQEQMRQFSEEIVAEARRVNPRINFIIKYPNWYESYQETGYNPGVQKHVFDMIYTGTESRDPYYFAQHLQRYLFLCRFFQLFFTI